MRDPTVPGLSGVSPSVCPGRNGASRGANRGSLGLSGVMAPTKSHRPQRAGDRRPPERQHHLCPAPRGRLHEGRNPAPSPLRPSVPRLPQRLRRRTPTPHAAGLGNRGRPRLRDRRRPQPPIRALRLGPAAPVASPSLRCRRPPRRPDQGDQHAPEPAPHRNRHLLDARHRRDQPRPLPSSTARRRSPSKPVPAPSTTPETRA